jgi:hypothetical protein
MHSEANVSIHYDTPLAAHCQPHPNGDYGDEITGSPGLASKAPDQFIVT